MLPPHELKNKKFSKAMRGYNPVEVDEYIEFLVAKYTELYRENDELERKLRSTVTRLDELKGAEDEIRSTLIDAKRAANKIKADAEARAEAIVRSAKVSCNTILADFNSKIDLGRNTIADLQRDAFALKIQLFERYSEHIKSIEKLTEGLDDSYMPDPEELRREAVEAIKSSIADLYPTSEDETKPTPEFTDPDGTAGDDAPTNTWNGGDEGDDGDDGTVNAWDDAAEGDDALVVDRGPLIPEGTARGLKESAKELGRQFRDMGSDDIIHTPDSDIDDDASYMEFVKTVTAKSEANTAKDADFNMLFDDSQRINKKKK